MILTVIYVEKVLINVTVDANAVLSNIAVAAHKYRQISIPV